MKLYEQLPTGVTVNGRFFRCDFDFRNVLKMLDLMQRDDIIPDARDYLCLRCVYRHKITRKTVPAFYDAVCLMLFGQAAKTDGKRLTSYDQDAGLIRSAFRQVYGIDLFRARLHWLEFVELLQNLPDGNRYEEVIEIRARPMPAANKYNQKEREWLMKAKQTFALHLTEREQAEKYEKDVSKIFSALLSMTDQKEVKTDE